MKEFLGNISFWLGLSLGSLTIIDFLLRDKQKKWLTTKAEILWFWLNEQKAGKFINLFLQNRVQKTLVILSHLFLVWVIISDVTYATGELLIGGEKAYFPGIYELQMWIEIASVILSMFIVTRYLHPLVLNMLGMKSIDRYLSFSFSVGIMLCLLFNIIHGSNEKILEPTSNFKSVEEYENYFGGKAKIMFLHLCLFLLLAPLTTELFVFVTMFTIGAFWTLIIYIVIIVFRVFEFLLLRIAENPKGPVIALSGLLTGIGAVIKVFLS